MGLPWEASSSIASWRSTCASASRNAPRICGRFRNDSGSWRFLDDAGSQIALPSSRPRRLVSAVARPGYGLAAAIAGWSIDGLTAMPSRLSAPARSIASVSSEASSTASAAAAVENALLPRSASPSPCFEGQVREHGDAEVGHLGEVGLADRAEGPDARSLVVVQRCDESIGERRPDARIARREPVGQTQHRGPDERSRGRVPLRDLVLAQDPVRVGRRLGRTDLDAFEDADRRAQPVDRIAGRQPLLDDGSRREHPCPRIVVQLDGLATAGDADHLVASKVAAGQDHGHVSVLTMRESAEASLPLGGRW